MTHEPYETPTDITCPHCAGLGYNAVTIFAPEFDVLLEKVQEVKTKINQMQADINYIKAKVG